MFFVQILDTVKTHITCNCPNFNWSLLFKSITSVCVVIIYSQCRPITTEIRYTTTLLLHSSGKVRCPACETVYEQPTGGFPTNIDIVRLMDCTSQKNLPVSLPNVPTLVEAPPLPLYSSSREHDSVQALYPSSREHDSVPPLHPSSREHDLVPPWYTSSREHDSVPPLYPPSRAQALGPPLQPSYRVHGLTPPLQQHSIEHVPASSLHPSSRIQAFRPALTAIF